MIWPALFIAPWLVFSVWWLVRSRATTRTVQRESRRSRASYLVLFIAGALLLGFSERVTPARLWPASLPLTVASLAVEVAGIAFAIWAREHLGQLWSGTVTLKDDHRIVRSGPYGLVRHPIYTGMLAGVVGVALARGAPAAVLALPLFATGFYRKIVLEERVLLEHFGEDYLDYRRKVRALIPFLV